MSGLILPIRGHSPKVHPDAFIAPNATLTGQVSVGSESTIWYGAVLRADVCWIEIGDRTSIQDNSVIHVTDESNGTRIGNDVTVGHRVVLHGCVIHDTCLVGMGSVVLDRAIMEEGSMLAAGSVLTPGKVVKSGEMWAGSPARFMRNLTDAESTYLIEGARYYCALGREHIAAISGSK